MFTSSGSASEPTEALAPDDLENEALERNLGQREREIMYIVCGQESATVQQVSEHLSTELAYTTVMTTLDRLFKKGFLRRKKEGRAYLYSARLTRREIEGQRAAGLVRRFFSDSEEHADLLVSCLVDAVHHYDTKLLDQLESRIRSAREEHAASEPKSGGDR